MEQERCQTVSLGVFLSLWNGTQNLTTPAIHYRIATWLQTSWENGQTRLLLQAFRASGKSTLAAIFCAWILYRDPDLRILVLSAESMLAEKMVRTIRKMIERHPSTAPLRPNRPDQWAADSFTVNRKRVSRDPSVLARGIHANITGSRADIILCDDVEVPNTADTPEKRVRLRGRLAENNFILTPGGTMLYIGTPHSYFSIYADMPRRETGDESIFLSGYHRMTIPIVGDHGKSVWPERYDDAAIEAIRLSVGPLHFSSQMMLEPVNLTQSRLDADLLLPYDESLNYKEVQKTSILTLCGRRLMSASAWWDPAFGRGSGDSSVVALVFTDTMGDRWLHHMEYIKVVPGEQEDEATQQCRSVAKLAREFMIPIVAVEINGIGKFLPAILRKVLADENINCAVVEKHSTQNKTTRILEAFDAVMAAKSLHVHQSVYQTPFLTEMMEWQPYKAGVKDDGLDAVSGALLLEPVRLPKSFTTAKKLWSGSGDGHVAVTDFDI